MSQIEAIYRHGVFEPLEPVDLPEEQRVRLNVEAPAPDPIQEWANRVQELRDSILKRHGGFVPDSTPGIAEDRLR